MLILAPIRMQFAVRNFIGNDSPFHARYASEFFTRIFARTFPTTAYSLWNTRWGDKEFLFHAYLAPFCVNEALLQTGAKLGAALLFAAVLCSVALILQRYRVPGALLWAALLPGLSVGWDFRMLMVRSHLASILLILWILSLFEQRRLRPLLILSFLYTWTYTAPYFALLLCSLMALWRTLLMRLHSGSPSVDRPDQSAQSSAPSQPHSTAPTDRRLLLGCLLATIAGMLIHPQTPNQILTDWIHFSVVAPHAWNLTPSTVELGSEFKRDTLREALLLQPGVLLGLLLAWTSLLCRPRLLSRQTLLFLGMTAPALMLYCLSGRFIEYLAPLTVLALALIYRDLALRVRLSHTLTTTLIAATSLLVVGLYLFTFRLVDSEIWHPRLLITQEQTGKWLAEHAQPGDLVVPLDWTQFPALYYYAPRLRYPVGLEPTTMEVVYPDKLKYLESLRLGERDLDMNEFLKTFPDARYIVLWKASGPAMMRLAKQNYTAVFEEQDPMTSLPIELVFDTRNDRSP